jgi:hypothetical protein
MALYFANKSKCSLCNGVIFETDERTSFGSMIVSTKSKYFKYSDRNFHTACMKKTGNFEKMAVLAKSYRERIAPQGRICYIDGTLITDVNDWVFIGYWTDEETTLLHSLTFQSFKLSNLREWLLLGPFISELESLRMKTSSLDRYITPILEKLSLEKS